MKKHEKRMKKWPKNVMILLKSVFLTLIIYSSQSVALYGQNLQPKEIIGKVVDSYGEPLVGAIIIIKGTTKGNICDIDGDFKLEVVSGDVLVVSFVGMISKEISYTNQSDLLIVLDEDILSLDAVVVIGYGSVKKSDLTGSVSSIGSDDFVGGVNNSPEKQIGGKVSGVQVTQTGGQPGGGTTIRIRGTNSIMGNNEPLFVIDGVPIGNSLGYDINPNDIASMEILKDASSTAIYGSRGANGVVLVTTKQGKAGATKVEFGSYVGVSSLDNKLEVLNAEELAEIHRRAIANGVAQSYDPDAISGAGTDWQDEVYQKGLTQNYQFTVSGGSEKTQYLFSANYFDEEGTVLNSDYSRLAIRSNITTKLSDKIKLISNLYASKSLSNVVSSGYFTTTTIGSAVFANPIYPVKDDSGTYTIYTDPTNRTMNPVAGALLQIREKNRNIVLSNISAIYDILPNLKLNVGIGANLYNNKNNSYDPMTVLQGYESNGTGNISHSNTFHWVSNNTLTYSSELFEDHRLEAMVGFVAEKTRSESFTSLASDFVTDALDYHRLQSGTNQSVTSGLYESQLASFLGRVNYNIKERYLFTVSGRYDGSSKFGSDNRWAFFPSAAFAWRISNEAFLNEHPVISNMKLRTSIGMSGEQAIGSYQTLPSLSSTGTIYAGNTYRIGFYPNRLENSELKWEKTTQVDVGFDIGLWNNRVTFNSDIYYKKTNDLLYQKPIPLTTGYGSIISNVGSIENKGIEFNLNTINTTGKIKWATDFNIAFNRNKVLDLGANPDGSKIDRILSPAGSTGNINYLGDNFALIVGEPIGGAYGYIVDGVYRSQAEVDGGLELDKQPGDPRKVDINNDGKIDTEDRKLISDPNPDFIGGMTNNFEYKGFELSLFLQWVVGNELFNHDHLNFSYLDGINNTQPWALNSWTEENSNTDIPRAGYATRETGMSTMHVEDGSYLRVKNLTLAYNLSNIKFLGIKKCRLYFSADNLLTFTSYSGYNPDVSAFGGNSISSGFDQSGYPLSKTFLFGVRVEF